MNEQNACKLLFDVADALDDAGLPFCLGYGTLLGKMQGDHFIPYDRDIDLCAKAEEFEPVADAIVEAMCQRGIQTEVINHRHAGYWDGRTYAVKFAKYGEHGDLTAFTKLGPYRYNPTHASLDPFCIVLAAEEFDSWRLTDFYGRQFNVPDDPERILDELYTEQGKVPHARYNEPCEHPAYKPQFLTKRNIAYVPMCLDVVHPGHLRTLKVASTFGKPVWVGLLTDEAIRKYKPEPVFDSQARMAIAMALKGVDAVMYQHDYLESLLVHKPAFVVHGEDWREGVQLASRQLVVDTLPHWGGKMVEVPLIPGYSSTELKAAIRGT